MALQASILYHTAQVADKVRNRAFVWLTNPHEIHPSQTSNRECFHLWSRHSPPPVPCTPCSISFFRLIVPCVALPYGMKGSHSFAKLAGQPCLLFPDRAAPNAVNPFPLRSPWPIAPHTYAVPADNTRRLIPKPGVCLPINPHSKKHLLY